MGGGKELSGYHMYCHTIVLNGVTADNWEECKEVCNGMAIVGFKLTTCMNEI